MEGKILGLERRDRRTGEGEGGRGYVARWGGEESGTKEERMMSEIGGDAGEGKILGLERIGGEYVVRYEEMLGKGRYWD